MTLSEFYEDVDTHKTRMIGQPCGKEIMTIPESSAQTYGQTDRQTELLYQITRINVLTRDNKKLNCRRETARASYQ